MAERVSGKPNKPWTQISWQQISLLTVSHCSGSRLCAKSCSVLHLSKTGITFETEALNYCFMESYITEWKLLQYECTFERHSCGLKDFRCWNCTIRTRNVGNMQNRWFSMEICIFSALFYCLEVYLTSSCHPKRPPEFCIGPRRIILKKSSLCVCGTLPKRHHRIILCRIILPWNDCMIGITGTKPQLRSSWMSHAVYNINIQVYKTVFFNGGPVWVIWTKCIFRDQKLLYSNWDFSELSKN